MPEVIFNGPEGRLEGRYSPGRTPTAPIALLLHPNPRHGGTMNNRVTFHLFQLFHKRGFAALRFNFRGVGRSQGIFDDGQGELSDAAAALDWLQTLNPNASQCWIGGYSFGSWIGMQLLMRRPEVSSFITIAPPADRYDFTFLHPCPVSGLIIQGKQDDIAPEESAAALAARLSAQRMISVDYRTVPGANHFFDDKIEQLMAEVGKYVDGHVKKLATVSKTRR